MKKEWQRLRLCEVAEVFDGPHATPTTVDSGPIFLGIGALQDGVINLGETRHVAAEDFVQWTRRVKPQADDVVFSYETRLGQAAIIPQGLECCLGRRMGLVRFRSGAIEPRFFLYQYLSPQFQDFLASKTIRGATVDRISIKEFPSFSIDLPPLQEQRRIVAILDEAFEGIATAKANAEKNLHNARGLLSSQLERVFGQRGADWHQAPLLSFASAISTGPFGSLLHKSDYVSNGVPLVNPINIVDGLIVPDPHKLIDSTTKRRLQSYVLREGDIVVGRRGEIGRCAVVGPNEAGWVCGTGCFFVRPLPIVRSAFIAHLIRSREYRARLELASTGATMKNLSNTALGELYVAVPPIGEQDRALALIGQLSEDCGRLEHVYERRLAALGELRKSLLHQAFTGALATKSTGRQLEAVA